MASLLDSPGDNALKKLRKYLKKGTECKVMWEHASKYFDKLESCINQVLLEDKSTTGIRKVFTDMETLLKSKGIYYHLRKPYQECKTDLLKASYLRDTFTTSPNLETARNDIPNAKQRSKDTLNTPSPIPEEKQKAAKIEKQIENKDAAVQEENKRLTDELSVLRKQIKDLEEEKVQKENELLRLKDEVTTLNKRIKELEEEQENAPSPKNLANVREKAEKVKEQQRKGKHDSETAKSESEIKAKLSLLYEEIRALVPASNKPPDQSGASGKRKPAQHKKEFKEPSDVDELFTKITENIRSGEECIKSLQDEATKLKDQLSADDNTIQDIDCKIKELMVDQTTNSPTVNTKVSKTQKSKNKKGNVTPEIYDARTAVSNTIRRLEQYVEDMRESLTRNEENIDNLKRTLDRVREETGKLHSANTKICNKIPGYEDNASSNGRQDAAQQDDQTDTSLEYEINIMAKVTGNLIKIVMPHVTLLQQEWWKIGNDLGVEKGDKSKVDTAFLSDVKEKIQLLIREEKELKRTGEQVMEKVNKLKQWNIKFKDVIPNFNKNASVEKANPDDDETMEVNVILNETEKCQSLLFSWIKEKTQQEQSQQEIQQKQHEDLQYLQEQLERKTQSIQTLTTEISDLESQKDGLLGRLSKKAGDQLTSGNPDITDLSDPNRPQKIGEQYSELYDNEWTDAYAQIIHSCGTERKCIDTLLKILKKSFEFCRQRADEQWNEIISAILLNNELEGELKHTEFKELKSMRKLAAVKSTATVQQEFRKTNILKDIKSEGTLKYTNKCIELCWYMAVQDPPLWLHWDIQHKEKLNENMFKPYTNSGTEVDFLVWPVLKMHQNGAIVTKGVCQPIKTKKPRT